MSNIKKHYWDIISSEDYIANNNEVKEMQDTINYLKTIQDVADIIEQYSMPTVMNDVLIVLNNRGLKHV